MVVRRAYKRIKINAVDVEALLKACKGKKTAVLGLDVAKDEIVACLRWGKDDFERPWSVSNPYEIGELVDLCKKLTSRRLKLSVALESTGTYGDSVRLAMSKAGITVTRVGGQRVSNYAETFDGVPSQHDGKDAAIIAELCDMGKGSPWPYETVSNELAEIGYHILRLDAFQREKVQWCGRLESRLARHWPELSKLVKPTGISMLSLLVKYGSPNSISTCGVAMDEIMAWSRGKISEAKAFSVVESARNTLGVPMNKFDQAWVQEVSQRVLSATRSVDACEQKLSELLKKDAFLSQYVDAVGAGTLGVIVSTVGDPRNYGSSGAFVKAFGLNLKELSSGKRIGEKAISKRGPSMARRWMYYWALRSVKKNELKEWYYRFHTQGYGHANRPSKDRKMKGLICLMRKLARSLWSSMQHGKPFEYSKVVGKLATPKRRRRKKSNQNVSANNPQN